MAKDRSWRGVIIVTILFFAMSTMTILACTSNKECSGEKGFCWSDGKCREIRQVIMSLKMSDARKTATHSLRLMEGDRICVTAMLNPMALALDEFSGGREVSSIITEYGNLPLQMFLYDLRLCSSDVNTEYSGIVDSWIPKTYLKTYDPRNHFSTGCFTPKAPGLSQHVVISHKESKGKHKKSVQLSKMVHGVVDERDEVSFSSENVAASACFDVHPVGPKDAPALVQASVVVVLDPAYNVSYYKTHGGAGGFTSLYIQSFGDFGDLVDHDDQVMAKRHDDLHTCLTSSSTVVKEDDSSSEESLYKTLTNKEKNKRLEHRHRRKRFDEEKGEEVSGRKDDGVKREGVEKESCGVQFNRAVGNAKVITVTSEDIVPSSVVGNQQKLRDGDTFNYESMQTPEVGTAGEEEVTGGGGIFDTLKHYYYYHGDDEDGYYYYYGHPYYHPHIHCKWSLEFTSGAGICESPHIIHEDSVHATVLVLAPMGIGIGIVFFIIDWKSRALFRK